MLVSSGAIAAGLAPLGLERRPGDLARQQAAASVGQGILVHRYTEEFARHGQVTGQVLLTVDDVTRRGHYRNAQRTFVTLLEMGVVPIVNENDTVATDEIRFGDNDRLAALVAHLVQADLLVLLSDVDGLYDGPPSRPGAQLIAEVHGEADLDQVTVGKAGAAGVGTGGMQTKLEAARIATGAGVAVVLTSAAQAGQALAGEEVGTLFHADRCAPLDPDALACPRDLRQGHDRPRRRCGPGPHRASRLAAPGRDHRRRRHLRRRATRSTWWHRTAR